MKRVLVIGIVFGGILLAGAPAPADEITDQYEKAVEKGLKWVSSTQHRDGHWEARAGQYPTTMTALGGMALLMEGSTLREGKYSDNIRRAVDWLVDRSQRNGLIGNPNNPTERSRYMYGHGFSLLFLASVYGEEEDNDRRKALEQVLTRAAQFCGKAQTNRGGWGYVSAKDGNGFDEGSVTITQVQALRAARNAGIVVPKTVIDKAHEYLKKCTTSRGGIIYSLARGGGARVGGERPPLTAAAVACMFSAGQYDSELCRKWLNYCRTAIPLGSPGRTGHDEYTQYYYAQVLYILGEDNYAKLFPKSNAKEHLKWSKYRKVMFARILRSQARDGSWTGGYIGPIFTTSVYLTILQLEKSTLPIYQR